MSVASPEHPELLTELGHWDSLQNLLLSSLGAKTWLVAVPQGFLVLLEDLEPPTKLVCPVRGTQPPGTAAEKGETITST